MLNSKFEGINEDTPEGSVERDSEYSLEGDRILGLPEGILLRE